MQILRKRNLKDCKSPDENWPENRGGDEETLFDGVTPSLDVLVVLIFVEEQHPLGGSSH